MTTVLEVPQWQGSGAPQAPRLMKGARRTAEYIEHAGIRPHPVDAIERALDGLAGPVYVHVDLDVLDPAEFASICYPEPDGVSVDRLVDLLSGVEEIVGASLTEHAPSDDGGLDGEADVIRRLGAALRR